MPQLPQGSAQPAASPSPSAWPKESLQSEVQGEPEAAQSFTPAVEEAATDEGVVVAAKKKKRHSTGEAVTAQEFAKGNRVVHSSVSDKADLDRAFVVNVGRFIDKCELLDLCHFMLQSTAVAALTMTAAGTLRQARNTGVFVIFTYVIYFLHHSRYDILEISDMMRAIDVQPSSPPGNPNGVLKCMTLTVRGLANTLEWTLVLSIYFGVLFLCYLMNQAWAHQCPDDFSCPEAGTSMLAVLVSDANDDMEALSMQFMVFTLILVLHALFEIMIWYETRSVMPLGPEGQPWNLEKDGVPWKYWLLGLPSMWFTSQAAKDEVERFMRALHGVKGAGVKFYPEQLAKLAIVTDHERTLLVNTLKNAAFYDVSKREYHESVKLGIHLVFYTDTGDYMNFDVESVDVDGSMSLTASAAMEAI